MKRIAIASSMLVLTMLGCKTADTSSDELAAKTVVGGDSLFVWLHGSTTQSFVYDANGNLASANSGKPMVCGYFSAVPGNSDLGPEDMKRAFSLSKAYTGSSGVAKYVDYDMLITAIERRIANRANIASEQVIDPESRQVALGVKEKLAQLSRKIEEIWTRPLGPKSPTTPSFETVYKREMKKEKFCRGAFGIGENKTCLAAYAAAKVDWKAATEAYISNLKEAKSQSRVPECNVPSSTDSGIAYRCNDLPTIQYLTEEVRQRSKLEYANTYKVYRQVRAFIESTNQGPYSSDKVISGKVTSETKLPDGYSSRTVLNSELGGLVSTVEVPGVNEIGLNDIREEFRNAIDMSQDSTCPSISTLLANGLWFHWNKRTNLAPVPVQPNDELAWIPTTPRAFVTVGNDGSNVTCQAPSTGVRANAMSTVSFYDKTAKIMLRDRRFFICGFEQGVPLDAGTVLTVKMDDFMNNKPTDPAKIAPVCANGQECPGTPPAR